MNINDFGSSSSRGNFNNRPRYIHQVTCKQLHNATLNDGKIYISKRQVADFSICGYVAEISTDSLAPFLLVDDTTHPLEVFVNLTSLPNIEDYRSKFIRVYGYVRAGQGNTVLPTLTHVKVIKYEEVIHHQVDALWWHLKSITGQLNDGTNEFGGMDGGMTNVTMNNITPGQSFTASTDVDPNDIRSIFDFFTSAFEALNRSFTEPTSKEELTRIFNASFPAKPITVEFLEQVIKELDGQGLIYCGGPNEYFLSK